jgi:exonuclease SbcC
VPRLAEASAAVEHFESEQAAPGRIEQQLERDRTMFERAKATAHLVEQRREVMRTVRDEARTARTALVRRVFTDSLNRTWSDLFVRLAPTEAFVPVFRVPDDDEDVVAVLETVHRDGSPGGPPAAMLSAGNLNTAALTLFLALNLSVEQRLPWLLLDDPVQSMDEVHVAQFAALLRTLTRDHGRRVIIAVHERALFDYLALELSPARPDDGLITVQLTRPPDGRTDVVSQYHEYVEDRAFHPA